MRQWGTFAWFSARPALSAAAAATFLLLAVLIAGGWLPRAEPGTVSQREAIAMAVVCAVIAGYFVRCVRVGWRRGK